MTKTERHIKLLEAVETLRRECAPYPHASETKACLLDAAALVETQVIPDLANGTLQRLTIAAEKERRRREREQV